MSAGGGGARGALAAEDAGAPALGDPPPAAGSIRLVASDVDRAAADPASVPIGAATVQALGAGLYGRLVGTPGNLALSPYSAAAALAMTANGAVGATRAGIRRPGDGCDVPGPGTRAGIGVRGAGAGALGDRDRFDRGGCAGRRSRPGRRRRPVRPAGAAAAHGDGHLERLTLRCAGGEEEEVAEEAFDEDLLATGEMESVPFL